MIKKSVVLFLITLMTINIICINCFAEEGEPIAVHINAREMNVIIARLTGFTENMVNSEYADKIDDYIPVYFRDTFSDRERKYYNGLYNIYNKYEKAIEANPVIKGYAEFSVVTATRYDFTNAMMLCNGIVGPAKYIEFKAKELGYLPRSADEKTTSFMFDENINLGNVRKIINVFLKNVPIYYYSEKDFLKGNTELLKNDKKMTNYELLCKNLGYKSKEEIYDYALKDITVNDYVKRVDMIASFDKVIGYTGEKFYELLNSNKISMPYRGEADDILKEYYGCMIAYATYYFNIEKYNVWDEVISHTDPKGYTIVNEMYTIRAQEWVTGEEVVNHIKYYLETNNLESKNIDEAAESIELGERIKKNEFDKLIDAFKMDLE